MFGWLTHTPRKPAAPAWRRARLVLEGLETRNCLSAPAITSLTSTILPGHVVQLSGSVADANPAGASISFSGAATGTTTADNNGHFNWTTTTASLGTVSVVAVDQLGFTSAAATAGIVDAAPNLTLSLGYNGGRTITLSGQVADVDAGSCGVTFSGVVNCSVATNADGTFSLTTRASGLGTVQATATNLWGLVSNTAQVKVTSRTPVITNLKGVEGQMEYWTFSGRVDDENPGGLQVCLGGLPSLEGKKAEVNADGTWSYTLQLQVGEEGTATFQVTDCWGLVSQEVYWIVQQT